jgi:hypothetical protein
MEQLLENFQRSRARCAPCCVRYERGNNPHGLRIVPRNDWAQRHAAVDGQAFECILMDLDWIFLGR